MYSLYAQEIYANNVDLNENQFELSHLNLHCRSGSGCSKQRLISNINISNMPEFFVGKK